MSKVSVSFTLFQCIKFLEFHRAEEGIALGRSATEDLKDDILKAADRFCAILKV